MKRMLVFAVVLFLLLLGLPAWAYDPDAPRSSRGATRGTPSVVGTGATPSASRPAPEVCRTPAAPASVPIPYPNRWR